MTTKPAKDSLKRIHVEKKLKDYTYLGCPLTRNRTPWCFRICTPDAEGCGECGRLAPHSFKSRIQQGIEDYKRKQSRLSSGLEDS